MNKVATTILKVLVLAGGGAAGALLARWYDEYMINHARERADYDRTRYEKGLEPIKMPIQERPIITEVPDYQREEE